ncbi:hypothetical protein [Butyrivibrio sp. VCD2006]|uniref:hypothetical protein n=1 Tax=Butyrivibrio sp. VCD2006 TaxID=1280664 RepID=UPI0003F90744|nr:hypothetical protein [Butyrivibrio sp. VCD2006]
MRKIYGIIITIAVVISIFSDSALISTAANNSDGIQINGEYLISDTDGMHSEYVLIAKNISGIDLTVTANFFAASSESDTVKAVSDTAPAIKNGQTFILYGQFKNSDLENASGISYKLTTAATNSCKYDAVNVDASANEDGVLEITGTNYSSEDVSLVNVRTVFFKDGTPVGFDHVNLGDSAYSFRSGSSNSQELGMIHPEYDNYIITYTVADEL